MRRATSSPALRAAAIGALVVALFVPVGCGGSGSDSTTQGPAAGTGNEAAGSGSGSIRSFGEPAGPEDRDAEATTVHRFLRAQADGDSATACSLMSASTLDNLEVFVEGDTSNSLKLPCRKLVEAVRSQIQAKRLAQADRIQVTGVRIAGDRGVVLYRDARGTESAFPVVREGSAWKVAAIAGRSLP
jgi:hypothetical protein